MDRATIEATFKAMTTFVHSAIALNDRPELSELFEAILEAPNDPDLEQALKMLATAVYLAGCAEGLTYALKDMRE